MRVWAFIAMIFAGAAMAEPVQMIERFDAGANERWRYIGDNVMGGVSSGTAQVTPEGMHLSGSVSTDNNGGFIQVRRDFPDGLAADASALVLKVRGNGERYTVFLRTRQALLPWHNYKATFVAGAAWSEVRLELSAFERSSRVLRQKLDPSDVKSIGLAAYGADYEADVWVGEVRVE
ncbi:CIA30 family protein [Planktotalea arctica]|uniref:CIA30 family protein n=1 Tax=Planktotalea arctica TaxID=1481893 RepID=UPI000A173CEF|nr:CIA30 family protein [Planktotalea arctica]